MVGGGPVTPASRATGSELAGEADVAIEVTHLRKTYGTTVAVDDVSFSVREGEIFGILGPNGAGKTTTVECVIGLRSPDAGAIRVMGLDPHVDREELHAIVGVQLQASALPARLKVGEILDLFHSFYQQAADLGELMDSSGAGREAERLLQGSFWWSQAAALDRAGAHRQSQGRRARRDDDRAWTRKLAATPGALIEGVRDRGVTIILVTHYMDEAERLCDRVALLDQGRIVAIDTPEGLADQAGVDKRVRFVPSKAFDDRLLTDLPEVRTMEHEGEHVIVTGSGELANVVILTLAAAGVTATDLHLDSANLEDAFVQLTGRHLHDEIGRIHR